ncbi:aldehyde dehydrogenase family protein [Amycolatopsis acidiphila]|uniref:Aldehyde dehydrogenase family protein n=1 Tax=Amycolatopsis acidiphila TaxID=715473 RepID=A0A558AFU6_9PSEU|nr:aldehyde dehydrogenase family protein [Amycolatopsis acidiphila]TVT23141.1 aldehyde dehydrogenase family protein [Amycolatopsis acidiphila]UIJ60171.1 aldehyde dehydrogenase family protein [Amycolatopsis acidiphila]GHG60944.1 aldehyde dehydrogenase [Amycolatopsis acidiphila]
MFDPYPAGLPIGPGWVSTPDTQEIEFPYDGSPVAEAPLGTPELARRALDEAVAVRKEVAALPAWVRRDILLDVHRALTEWREEFEGLLVAETGKPLCDCRVEVACTLVTWQAAAEEVGRIHGETVPLDLAPSGDGLTGFWKRKPIGVVVGIAGFNYPLLLASHKIAPAIAAGCPVIVKPAPQTPLATLWLVHLVRAAAAIPSMVQLVTGDAEVGSTLVTDRRVGAVSFTGSAAVGHRIAKDAAPTKTLLELGSNAALVVAEDADLGAAADAVLRGGFYASGQACISVQRVLAVESVADELTERVLARLGEVVAGDPRDEKTRVSALIDERSTKRVLDWIADAVAAGAKVAAGGHEQAGVVRPTVLTEVPDGVACWDEEIFGPVVCVRRVSDVDAAFEQVNVSRYGLHASVFTRSLATAFRAIDELEVGGVVVNEVPGFRSDTMPYGGVKDSGIGREGPRFAIDELTVTRMAVLRR